MRHFRERAPALLFAVAIGLTGCAGGRSSGAAPASNGSVTDADSLIAHLRESGFRAERADRISQPFFRPTAVVVRVNDEEMQVYEYGDEQTAVTEASRVGANGRSVGTNQVGWIAPPHFFRKRKLLVVYLGSNEQALLTIRGLLGKQFAGD